MLCFVDLTKFYALGDVKVAALAGVSGELAPGRMTALVGPSGSGKSTLLQLLGLIDEPGSGRIVFDGERLDGLSDAEKTRFRQRTFGFVFQSYHLVPTLTAAENVMLPRLLAGGKSGPARAAALALLARVGLADVAERDVRRLSGGQRQRVAIARALINGPRVVFADEPTANLDAGAGDAVVAMLRGLCLSDGVTLVMATHNAGIAALADDVLSLHDGRLAAAAPATRGVR